MKHSLSIVFTLASGLALSAAAQTPAVSAATPATTGTESTAPSKIAVIAFQVAVAQTNEGQRDFADLEKKYEPKRAALKTLSDEVDTLTKQLQTQGATMSDAERNEKANSIDSKKKQLDRDAQDAQNDFQQEMQDMYNSVASKVYDVMQAYAEKEGFTLVLDVSQQQSPVLFANNSTNITKPVIDLYNEKSGVPAPPPSATSDAPKPAPKPAAPAAKPAAH